ncbi:hypothetical protein BaRGS_00010913 [Batillaria attramentaria]|uniref:Uncharacterized protein n=1 Tax=Batillaria attramentaria TaxID=370345 RepID=A0ABD0LE83_9CAEN
MCGEFPKSQSLRLLLSSLFPSPGPTDKTGGDRCPNYSDSSPPTVKNPQPCRCQMESNRNFLGCGAEGVCLLRRTVDRGEAGAATLTPAGESLTVRSPIKLDKAELK